MAQSHPLPFAITTRGGRFIAPSPPPHWPPPEGRSRHYGCNSQPPLRSLSRCKRAPLLSAIFYNAPGESYRVLLPVPSSRSFAGLRPIRFAPSFVLLLLASSLALLKTMRTAGRVEEISACKLSQLFRSASVSPCAARAFFYFIILASDPGVRHPLRHLGQRSAVLIPGTAKPRIVLCRDIPLSRRALILRPC